jgi:hypothetical protein
VIEILLKKNKIQHISYVKLYFNYIMLVYKLAKIFTICVSVQKIPVARLAKPPKPEFTNRK